MFHISKLRRTSRLSSHLLTLQVCRQSVAHSVFFLALKLMSSPSLSLLSAFPIPFCLKNETQVRVLEVWRLLFSVKCDGLIYVNSPCWLSGKYLPYLLT